MYVLYNIYCTDSVAVHRGKCSITRLQSIVTFRGIYSNNLQSEIAMAVNGDYGDLWILTVNPKTEQENYL